MVLKARLGETFVSLGETPLFMASVKFRDECYDVGVYVLGCRINLNAWNRIQQK